MTTIKTPITDLIIKINDIHVEYEYHFSAPHGNFSIYEIAKYIESGFDAKILTSKLAKSDDCIDKQTAIDFCQSMLKDYSTIEVTQETLNNFLNNHNQ